MKDEQAKTIIRQTMIGHDESPFSVEPCIRRSSPRHGFVFDRVPTVKGA